MLAIKAFHSNQELKFLLLVTCGYWTLNFILRPMITLRSCSTGVLITSTDFRICANPHLVIDSLLAVVIGCSTFLIAILVFSKFKYLRVAQIDARNPDDQVVLLILLALTGGLALLIEQTSMANIFSKSLMGLTSINFSVFLWIRKTIKIPPIAEWFLWFVGMTELLILYSETNYSKGVLLTPLLIFIYKLEMWNKPGSQFRRVIIVIFLIMLFLIVFNYLQEYKLGKTFDYSATLAAGHFSVLLLFLLPISQRFDQFPRIVDAQLASDLNFHGFSNWISEIGKFLSWNPSSGRTDSTFGQIWNTQITSQSVPNAELSKVSLAQGFIADGILWNGYYSLIIEACGFALIYLYLAMRLAGNLGKVYLAFCLISNGALFESGSVAMAALISGALKIFLTFKTLEFIISYRRRKINDFH